MTLERAINEPILDKRPEIIIAAGQELSAIKIKIDCLKKEIEWLREPRSKWSVFFDQVGVSRRVSPSSEICEELVEVLISLFEQKIKGYQSRMMDICRKDANDKTNGEVWIEKSK